MIFEKSHRCVFVLYLNSKSRQRQRQQEQIRFDWYLMNGLLVTLPLLLLLFSSLYTSHAPILVLKKTASAFRVSLHSWVLNYSGENNKRHCKEDRSLQPNWTTMKAERKSHTSWVHHRIICLIYRLGSTESSCLGKPKLPECNAANTIWVCRLRAGGYGGCLWWASRGDASVWSILTLSALTSDSWERLRCQACMSL